MSVHIGDVPRPMYAYVRKEFLYDHKFGQGRFMECMIYGLSAMPGRAWGLSALLKDGAMVQNLPVHAFSLSKHNCLQHTLPDLQVWSCYGQEFAAHEYSALREMPVLAYMKRQKQYVEGRYWFTAAPYDDMYSMTPDQHKHFNFIWLDCGCLASLPGNRMFMYDSSFVELPTERPPYKVNTHKWFVENLGDNPFDDQIDHQTG